jgi:hypothetical protein
VRWTYQLPDPEYNVRGEAAAEDFYFYPDGFGTRTLTLFARPKEPFQISEFVIFQPQSVFPLQYLPSRLAEAVSLDGIAHEVVYPMTKNKNPKGYLGPKWIDEPAGKAFIYRIYSHKDDNESAIYFSPRDVGYPEAYNSIFDRGELVAPTYWGNPLPLWRGKRNGRAIINDGINLNPSISSVGGWLLNDPKPDLSGEFRTIDALGRSRVETVQKWTWLIAQTAISNYELADWAKSFSSPPSLGVQGANIGFPAYAAERRAIRLAIEADEVQIRIQPETVTMNPVFELAHAPGPLESIRFDGQALTSDDYAYDGNVLWIRRRVGPNGADVVLSFRGPSRAVPHDGS